MKFLYQFSARQSFMHSLDPRTKLLMILSFLVVTFLFPYPWIMLLVIPLILWVGARIKPSEYAGFVVLLLPLIVGITLVHLLTRPEPYFFSIGFLHLSTAGLRSGLTVASRLAAMGFAFMLFSMTTDPFDWGLSLYQSGLPYRIAFMFAFAMRLLPLIQEEVSVIGNALAARAYDGFETRNPVKLMGASLMCMFPLAVGAMRRSQDIAMAMELRGISCAEDMKIERTVFRDIRIRPRDRIVMGAAFLLVVAVILYGAWAGTLPHLTVPQIIFAVVLITILVLVGRQIGRVISATEH